MLSHGQAEHRRSADLRFGEVSQSCDWRPASDGAMGSVLIVEVHLGGRGGAAFDL